MHVDLKVILQIKIVIGFAYCAVQNENGEHPRILSGMINMGNLLFCISLTVRLAAQNKTGQTDLKIDLSSLVIQPVCYLKCFYNKNFLNRRIALTQSGRCSLHIT